MAEKWKQETSAGGIVYKQDRGRVYFLLINPNGPNFGPATNQWTFPKGLLDHDNETKEQVAVREVREEGGVIAQIKQELGYIKYFRASTYFGNAIKFVHFYLMEYVSGSPDDHDSEVAEAKWVVRDEVLGMLAWKHDKEIYDRALKALQNVTDDKAGTL